MKQKIILGLIALLMLSALALTVNASYTIGEGIDGYVYRCGIPAEGIVVRVYNSTNGLEGYGVIPDGTPTKGELGTSITDVNGYYHVAWLAGGSHSYTVVAETSLGNIIGTAEVLYLGCGETRRVDFCYCPGVGTFTIGYWKNHLEDWPVTSLTIGGVTYNQIQLLGILRNANSKDATYMLAAQLVGAKLNVANGADSSSIATTIANADAFLTSHPLGSNPRNADRDYALDLKDALDSFNNGD
jgi:hypothetical protein